ncbi:hypothetical protein BJ875DRAFT_207437 [Amylocarpus encephaloides]|uniref:Uncharacterized protein n=1 Tax=Amylocarpus encephaloides TaxID=45428 RepID=A0A9P8C1I4_9HELO|nr:hypothetical protein BJ875DRAFT_207437 [Amylocarpus encephaloides]
MSDSEDLKQQEVDEYADWDLFIPLVADDADSAGFRIKDAPGGESERVFITGYDRRNATAVRGRLFHVVHGVIGNGSNKPATLIVFEWLFVPGRLGHRFREVNIDVTFAPRGSRPGRMPGADMSGYTPEVKAVAPNVPIKSYFASRDVTKETGKKAGLTLGYAPYASFSPEVSGKTTEVTARTDYRFVAGYPAFVNKTWGEPNSVHWTLQENSSQESGTPHLLRTAVLVQRQAGDYGMFSAAIDTSVNVSVLVDAAEALRKLVKLVPNDDPVSFDPKPVKDDQ